MSNPLQVTILDGTGTPVTVSTLDKITTQLPAALGSAAAVASSPVTIATDDGIQAKLGIVTETAPASDTASSGLNGRLQRIAQRLSSLIALLPTALGAGGGLKVDGSGTALPVSGSVSVSNLPATQPISAASLPLPAGAALETGGNLATVATAQGNSATGITIPTGGLGILGWLSGIFNKLNTSIAVTGTFWQATQPVSGTVAVSGTVPISAASLPLPTGAALDATLATTNTEVGGLTETAPATDTASSGLNGRLQRVAQRLSSLIALLPTALGAGGGLKVDGSGTALPVSQGAASLVSATLQNAALATGNGTALNVSGMSAAVLTVNIVTTATVVFEATQDGTNYSAVNAVQLGTSSIASSVSTPGITLWEMPVGGYTSLRARISAWTAGAVTVTGQAVPVPYNAKIISANLTAGTNTIGQVNGNGASVEVVPTVTAGAYTAGFVVGGIMTFANILPASLNGVLESIVLKFKGSAQTTEFDVALFSASPAGTFTEHAAPAIAAADTALLLGVFPMTANLSPLGTHTVYTLDGIAKQIIGSSTSLFAVVTTKSVPVNPASTTDMSLRLGMIW